MTERTNEAAGESDDFKYTLTRRALRQIKAEAWEECAKESHALGWLHDWALSDLLARNPHRTHPKPEPPTGDGEREGVGRRG